MVLTLSRAQTFLRLDDPAPDDDFDILDDGKRIGRVYFQTAPSQPWRWSLSLALAVKQNGRADTRAQAIEALSRAYSELGQANKATASEAKPRRNLQATLAALVYTENLHPDVVVMKSAKDRV